MARRTRCVETELQLLCTATLVAPRVMLTAAHCLDMLGPKGGYEVLFAPSVDGSDAQASWSVVMETKIHPDYDPNAHAWDLALLLLASPSSITPAHLTTETMDASDVSDTVTVVGFGQRTQDATSVGMRQRGTMQISDVTDASFVTVPAPSMSCKGDSGGPIFRSGTNAEELIGVTASGDQGCTQYAVNVRVDAARTNFIDPFLAMADQAPSGWPDDALDPGQLCSSTCTDDTNCPAALRCLPQLDQPNHCVLVGLEPGNFMNPCAKDMDCGPGGTCARLKPTGQDACRCLAPCHGIPAPDAGLADGAFSDASRDGGAKDGADPDLMPGPDRGCGCRTRSQVPSHGSSVPIILIVLTLFSILRSRRKTPRS